MNDQYRFAFDQRFAALLKLLGVRPRRAHVTIGEHSFEARFGPWLVTTPLSNIRQVSLTGPHSPLKAIGPRFSPTTRSLTFGSNADRTVRIEFHRPVPGMEPLGIVKHPALSVSVAKPNALRDQLETMIGAD